ncbi:hypothetical protein BGZ76_003162 [Entomortierella beljakovae]|nr:hypothetical protein BGZ76_003162 [Entomortierella beljakovae]
MLRQIARTISTPKTQIRSITSVRSVDEPSANFRAGKEGFAPGMPHPPGTSPSPAPAPAPRTVESLPKMSQKHQIKPDSTPAQKFKFEMTKLRHEYQKEHFAGEDIKRSQNEKDRAGSLRRLQRRQENDRVENEQRLSFEKLMQPNGEMGLSGPEHQAQIAEFVKARKVKRQENFRQVEERASEKRLDAMIKLYHSAEDFVTMENLDAKINEFYEAGLTMQSKVYVPGVQDMVADVMDGGGQVSYPDLLKREEELRDALEGTVSGGRMGYENVKGSESA